RLAKMPRSSGQKAIPWRAIRYGWSAIVSVPAIFTEPLRFGVSPIPDFRVVLLPAPLRATSVTSSPARTSRSTPWSTCDSPYQACSPLIESSASAMLRPQVGGDHGGVLRNRLVLALGQHLASREHGDAVRELGDDAQVVLHHQHGPVLRHPLDQGGEPLR